MSGSFSDFVSGIEAWLSKEARAIEAAGENLVETVISDVEIGLEELAGIAGNAVLTQAGKVVTGQEKFGAAVADTIQTVEAAGKTVLTQTAQMAVQAAYTAVQGVLTKPAA